MRAMPTAAVTAVATAPTKAYTTETSAITTKIPVTAAGVATAPQGDTVSHGDVTALVCHPKTATGTIMNPSTASKVRCTTAVAATSTGMTMNIATAIKGEIKEDQAKEATTVAEA